MKKIAFAALWLFVFTIPWDRSLNFGGELGYVGRVTGFLAFTAALFSVFVGGSLRRISTFHVLLIAFLSLVSVSIFWTANPLETPHQIRLYIQSTWVAWLLWQSGRTSEALRKIRLAFVLGECVLVGLTIQSFLQSTIVDTEKEARFSAAGWNWNDMAVMLCLGIPMACELALGKGKVWQRAIGYVALLFSIIGIFLTSSRTGMVGAAVALTAIPLLARKANLGTKAVVLLAMAVTAGFSLILLPQQTFERLATAGNEMMRGNLNDRTMVWAIAFTTMAAHLFFGVGAGAFAAGTGNALSAHNTLLQVGTEEGLVGLTLYLLMLGCVVLAIMRTRGNAKICSATILASFLVCTFAIHWADMPATWFVLGLIIAQGATEDTEVRAPVRARVAQAA